MNADIRPPSFSETMTVMLYILTWWLLYILSPAQGHDPSELFKTLATAVVLTAFVNGAIGAIFTASRDGQKKNDTIAKQASMIADAADTGAKK